jgi:hypothetical protein
VIVEPGWQRIGTVVSSCNVLAICDARGGPGVEPAMQALWDDVVANRNGRWPTYEFHGPGKRGIPGESTGLFVRGPHSGDYPVDARFCDLDHNGELWVCELRVRLHGHDDGDGDRP